MPTVDLPPTIYPDNPKLKELLQAAKDMNFFYRIIYNDGVVNHYKLLPASAEKKKGCGC